MKKLLALLLVAVMAVSMAACGNSGENQQAGNDADSEITQTQHNKQEDDGFDTSWASNEYEALLPQLPLTGWTTEMDGNIYKMELGGLKTETLTDADGNTTGYGEDKAAIINYVESLTAYGFTVEETGGIEGYVYEWKISDPVGNKTEITCAEGYCWIEIEKK